MTANVVLVIVVGAVLLFLWRRRAGRRAMAAQERIASVLDPAPPKGRYPKPARGIHRMPALGGIEVVRVCSRCTRLVPADAGPVGEGRWLLVDVCGACAREVGRRAAS